MSEPKVPFMDFVDSIHVHLKAKSIVLSKTDPRYAEVLAAVSGGAEADEILAVLEKDLRVFQTLSERVSVRDGAIYYDDDLVDDPVLTERILRQLKEGWGLAPFVRFLENLYANPAMHESMQRRKEVQRLFAFLEKGMVCFTPDGCFLAYKAVNADYSSIHKNRDGSDTWNRIGETVKMPRHLVNPDPKVTCAEGLHVCSFSYLPHFAHAQDGRVVVCKVNPRDVVAVPVDYGDAKMRVCEYFVQEEYENYYVEHPECRLSRVAVYSPEERPFRVVITGHYDKEAAFAQLSEAALHFEDWRRDPGVYTAVVMNAVTGQSLEAFENVDYIPMDDDEDEDFEDDEELEDDDPDEVDAEARAQAAHEAEVADEAEAERRASAERERQAQAAQSQQTDYDWCVRCFEGSRQVAEYVDLPETLARMTFEQLRGRHPSVQLFHGIDRIAGANR